MFNPRDYIRDSIEARRAVIDDAKQRGAYAAAAMIGNALGQPRNERAEERLAADLVKPTARPDQRCPKCNELMDYETASRAEPDTGLGARPGGYYCECGHNEDNDVPDPTEVDHG